MRVRVLQYQKVNILGPMFSANDFCICMFLILANANNLYRKMHLFPWCFSSKAAKNGHS